MLADEDTPGMSAWTLYAISLKTVQGTLILTKQLFKWGWRKKLPVRR